MSVALDANLLLYASDEASPFREQAEARLRAVADGREITYLFWPVAFAYLRTATHSSIFESPLSPAAAQANVDSLTSLPHVRSPGEDERFWSTYKAVADELVVRGNLVTDAHLVALMRNFGVSSVLSRDRDLRKFEGIKVIDPFDS
jgi:uncharacterized protein